MKLLDKIKDYKNLKGLSFPELELLAEEIRELLIKTTSDTGGHLASNLGVVELTIALHKAFSLPKDKIVFDVGHQSYVHKILSGRHENFSTLRQFGGISGFPKAAESEFDVFNSGHSSNSISVALGITRALRNKNDNSKVVAFIGDGALTGGMAYEALNDAARSNLDIIIVLNDNDMSISKNVGGMSKYLSKIRTSKIYRAARDKISLFIRKIPLIGKGLYKFISRIKEFFKNILINDNFFEELGFYYTGPFDGHDIKSVYKAFNKAKLLNRPVIIHTITKKGKGYNPAEKRPSDFHGVSAFDINTGETPLSRDSFSAVFGDEIIKIAEKNKAVTAITAAMPQGTGLSKFKGRFPYRFYDVAIAEGHAVGLAAGLAIGGSIPVFAVYSTFLQRGYDQLLTDVSGMNLHCIFCIDRAGLVGEDGETHHGVFDISYLTSIPNMTVMSPATYDDLRFMLNSAVNDYASPVAIRYPRGGEVLSDCKAELERGKAQILQSGDDITLICEGKMVETGLKIAELLKEKRICAEVINIRYIKPIDKDTVIGSINKTKKAVVLESNNLYGGLFSIISCLTRERMISVSIPDIFVEHGNVKELHKILKMDEQSVFERIIKEFYE